MAVPPDNQIDTMLEVEVANRSPTRSAATTTQVLPFPSSLSHFPIMISMTQEEYAVRPSRESVLQRLSEALLRRSLAKVRATELRLNAFGLSI